MSSAGKFKLLSLFLVLVLVAVGSVPIVERLTQGQQGGKLLVTIGSVADASGTADFVCDGVNDNVQFQLALNNLDATGGKILVVSSGTFNFGAGVTRAIPNVTIEGTGYGTYITGVASITAGGNNWKIVNLRFDNGGMVMGATTNWIWENVDDGGTRYTLRNPSYSLIGGAEVVGTSITDSGLTAGRAVYAGAAGLLSTDAGLTYDAATDTLTAGQLVSTVAIGTAPLTVTSTTKVTNLNADTIDGYQSGRSSTYTVAANNASAIEKAQADYLADGTNDEATIQAAITAAYAAGITTVELSSGTFYLDSLSLIETYTINLTTYSAYSAINIPKEYANGDQAVLQIIGAGPPNPAWSQVSTHGTILYVRAAAYSGIATANATVSAIYTPAGGDAPASVGDTAFITLKNFTIRYEDSSSFHANTVTASAVDLFNGGSVTIEGLNITVDGIKGNTVPGALPSTKTVGIRTPTAQNIIAWINIRDTWVEYYYTAFELNGDLVTVDKSAATFCYNAFTVKQLSGVTTYFKIRDFFNQGTPNGFHVDAGNGVSFQLYIENYQLYWLGIAAPFGGWNGSDDVGDGGSPNGGYAHGSVTWATDISEAATDYSFWETSNASGRYAPEYRTGSGVFANFESVYLPNTGAFSPTSGVQYYNDTKHNGYYLIPVTFNPTGIADATAIINVANGTESLNYPTEVVPATTPAGQVRNLVAIVPAGYYYTITVTNATIGVIHAIVL